LLTETGVAAIVIEKQANGSRGRYVAVLDGVEGEAELTFTVRAPDLVSADHTGTAPNMRGMGVAAALVERLVADARAEGFRIVPRCSYVRAQFEKHPEWSDLLAA
jgi:hypothetical protein